MEHKTIDKYELKIHELRLKVSKRILDKLTEGKDEMSLTFHIEGAYDPYIIPKEFSMKVIELIYDLLNKEIKKVEQQLKEF
jgi:hypothetical protein